MNRSNAIDRVEVGRALGHDLRRWSGTVRAHCPAPVREGFAAARAAGVAPRTADRYVRKWLQLRENALRRDRVIADDVTPDLLHEIDVPRCPITRASLTHGELGDADWSVDRINNDGAYAANNLAVMSVRANRAKGSRDFAEVHDLARGGVPAHGLTSEEWMRMASVMLGPCFVAQPVSAPIVPLAAPIPSLSVRPGYQQIQHVFTLGSTRPSGKNALIKAFRPASAGERSRARLAWFADAIHEGLKTVELRHDVWLRPGVLEAFIAWRDSQDERSRCLAGAIAAHIAGGTTLPAGRIDSWHLESRGYYA